MIFGNRNFPPVTIILISVCLFLHACRNRNDDDSSILKGDDSFLVDDSLEVDDTFLLDDSVEFDDAEEDDSTSIDDTEVISDDTEPGGFECSYGEEISFPIFSSFSFPGGKDNPCDVCESNCDLWDYPMGFFTCYHGATINGKTWTVCDNGKDICQYCAECLAWQLSFNSFCGYSDWRLPTIAELSSIYNTDYSTSFNCLSNYHILYILPPILLSCNHVWSSEILPDEIISAKYFNFVYGEEYQGNRDVVLDLRALAIRP